MNKTTKKVQVNEPLASRMRPRTLDEYVGQTHLLGEGKILRQLIEKDQVPSMIFWGPPGVGKTTLAQIIATTTEAEYISFSAVTAGVKQIKEIMQEADQLRAHGKKTIVFVDEIHRFNKAQQDAFLPFVEAGSITLIGATTENPSFELNAALLSRAKVFVLHQLSTDDIVSLLTQTLKDARGFGGETIELAGDTLGMIAAFANGDARLALNMLEMVVLNGERTDDKIVVGEELVAQVMGKRTLLYDKNGEEHYNIISALHKSLRNSDVNAAIYWVARMLEGGEDPLYIARRLVRFASEDVGMADSRALEISVAGYQACHFIGMPECAVHLAHIATYLALAPKSNGVYKAYNEAKKDALNTLAEPVPLHIRNAPTKLMKELEYGKGYEYAHDMSEKISGMYCLPDKLKNRSYYRPTNQGSETKVKKRMEQIDAVKKKLREDEEV
jgi:putative ATPase